MSQTRNQKPALTIPVDPGMKLELAVEQPVDAIDVDTPAENPENQGPPPSDEDSVLIEVPIYRPGAEADFPLHIDVRLTREQSHVLRKATTALDRQQARLRCGKRVVNPTDAVKYILELLHKSL